MNQIIAKPVVCIIVADGRVTGISATDTRLVGVDLIVVEDGRGTQLLRADLDSEITRFVQSARNTTQCFTLGGALDILSDAARALAMAPCSDPADLDSKVQDMLDAFGRARAGALSL